MPEAVIGLEKAAIEGAIGSCADEVVVLGLSQDEIYAGEQQGGNSEGPHLVGWSEKRLSKSEYLVLVWRLTGCV